MDTAQADLERGFDDLLGGDDRRRRGYQFQKWLSDVLFRSGFEVHQDPRIAKPRRTDIYARRAGHEYLFEAKSARSASEHAISAQRAVT